MKLGENTGKYIKEPSPPSRGRGLKHPRGGNRDYGFGVAPFTGAWIETPYDLPYDLGATRRPLHGGVD